MFVQIGNFFSFSSGGAGVATQFVSKASDTSRDSTTTLADDPTLVFASLAAGRYAFQLMGRITCGSATPGFKVGYRISTAPSTNDSAALTVFYTDGSGVFQQDSQAPTTAPAGGIFTTAAGTNVSAFMASGMFVIVSTSDFAFQWAQVVSNATPVILQAGSWLALTAIP